MAATPSVLSHYQGRRVWGEPEPSMGLPLDGFLLGVVLTLLLVGVVFVASASTSIATEYTGDATYYLQRHLIFVALGVVAAVCAFAVPMRWWSAMRFFALLASIVVLVAVLIIGREVNGSVRWIEAGPINIQASEIARLGLILYMAGYLAKQGERIRTEAWEFLRPALVFIVAAVLLLQQPDFGATVVLCVTLMGMLFMAGSHLLPFAISVSLGVVSFALLVVFSPYRVQRVLGFVDPWEDPYGASYQLVQSLIAIGRGQWLGVGLGQSQQKQGFMPESHTDFIYAVIGEELGLIGTIGLLALFCLLVWKIFTIATRAIEAGKAFMAYLAVGIGLWLGTQALVNMGVAMGVLPTKGLTLPFISYGGSSLIVTLAAMGILLRITYELRHINRRVPTTGRQVQRGSGHE